MLNESGMARSFWGVPSGTCTHMEPMLRRSHQKHNTLPNMAQSNPRCVPPPNMGMCSLHACTKEQMCTPRITHGKVCIHRVHRWVQKLEVLHTIHMTHCHIGKG